MAYIRSKKVGGHTYYYLVKSVRNGDKVRQVHKRYIGKLGTTDSWHTQRERDLIESFGGEPLQKYGYDGVYRGKPVEVRCIRKDHRFRIQDDTHEDLMKRKGYYIFDAPGESPVMVPASAVNDLLPSGEWYKDRKYSHKFITKTQIWDS